MLVFRLRGAGIPLVDRFFHVPFMALTDGSRVPRYSLIVARIEKSLTRPSSSSMLDMPLTTEDWAVWLLSDDRGRRLSVIGLVE